MLNFPGFALKYQNANLGGLSIGVMTIGNPHQHFQKVAMAA